jgi:hypothetical protein
VVVEAASADTSVAAVSAADSVAAAVSAAFVEDGVKNPSSGPGITRSLQFH